MRANPKDTTEPRHLITLWLHEVSRVFEDRLTCDGDRAWFRAQQEALLGRVFGCGWGEVVEGERLVYGDYLTPGAEPKVGHSVVWFLCSASPVCRRLPLQHFWPTPQNPPTVNSCTRFTPARLMCRRWCHCLSPTLKTTTPRRRCPCGW
jgi:hypothetical protein